MEALPDAVFAVLRNWAGIRGAELLGSNCLDHVTMSLCIIFLRMKGGERFRTSDLIQTGNLIVVSIPVFSVVVFEEVGLCHAGCRCNPAAFWSQRSSPAYAVYDGVCVEPISDLNRGTFFSCRPRLLQITRSNTAVWSHWDFTSTPLEILHHRIWNLLPFLALLLLSRCWAPLHCHCFNGPKHPWTSQVGGSGRATLRFFRRFSAAVISMARQR